MPLAYGSDALRKEAIPRLISGQDRMCFGVTEPNQGWILQPGDRADGPQGWVINGRKL